MSDSTAYRGDYSVGQPNDIKFDFVPFRGWKTTWTFQSTYAILANKALLIQVSNPGAGQALTRVGESPIWQLIVTFDFFNDGTGNTEVPINTWELVGNDIQKDLYEHPTMLAFGPAVATAIRIAVSMVASASASEAATAYANATGVVAAAINNTVAFEFFDLLVNGTTHFAVSEFVLRHTQTVSNSYTSQFALNDIEKLYTTAQLISEASIPSSIVFDISTIEAPADKSLFLWGWLKRSPQIVIAAGSKVQVTQEYWLDQWSEVLYQLKT